MTEEQQTNKQVNIVWVVHPSHLHRARKVHREIAALRVTRVCMQRRDNPLCGRAGRCRHLDPSNNPVDSETIGGPSGDAGDGELACGARDLVDEIEDACLVREGDWWSASVAGWHQLQPVHHVPEEKSRAWVAMVVSVAGVVVVVVVNAVGVVVVVVSVAGMVVVVSIVGVTVAVEVVSFVGVVVEVVSYVSMMVGGSMHECDRFTTHQ